MEPNKTILKMSLEAAQSIIDDKRFDWVFQLLQDETTIEHEALIDALDTLNCSTHIISGIIVNELCGFPNYYLKKTDFTVLTLIARAISRIPLHNIKPKDMDPITAVYIALKKVIA